MNASDTHPRKKLVADSRTEVTKLLKYSDINGDNRLFGGKLMAWIDEAAAITAMRHCEANVTTCSVDSLVFKKGAFLNQILVLIAKVTYVGKTSMEVRVDTFQENREDGLRRLINHAYLTLVCVDENGTPKEIGYGLELQNETEKMEWESALRRREIRRQRQSEGY